MLRLLFFLTLLFFVYSGGVSWAAEPLPVNGKTQISPPPLTEDERAAPRWLDYVTGPLSDAEEREWWQTGEKMSHAILIASIPDS